MTLNALSIRKWMLVRCRIDACEICKQIGEFAVSSETLEVTTTAELVFASSVEAMIKEEVHHLLVCNSLAFNQSKHSD